ncbi:MFS transporter [Nocardiopsis lambiniae]|uniref:MFS transporter n=1 Tax=Nocardiopsis lambiniae TaxID=3075539 RepID=A0ABU2M7I0_9ACTN|nr:MFS transporter [Nocardiopsis sp. DSM 44743]MDT0328543.1 MFS transporter [Nocardiopsis sp. DSM 44743]
MRRVLLAVLALAAVESLALSLRSGVGSLGALLPTLRDDLHLTAAAVGVLATLPTLFFALVGLGAGRVISRYGPHRVTILLLATIATGLVARALTGSSLVFVLATGLAMAGVAVGNVVLPALAKLHFPRRIVVVGALYGVAINLGATIAAVTAVPIGDVSGGWRGGLGVWAALPLLSLALWIPWAVAGRSSGTGRPGGRRLSIADAARTRLGWAMALCFGAQASQAYVQFGWWSALIVDAGGDTAHAGALLGVISGLSIPVSLMLPLLIRGTRGSLLLPIAFASLTSAGWIGVMFAPLMLDGWLWAALLGAGSGAFSWTLVMIGVRSRTPEGAGQLSAFVQGGGYLMASAATFATGLLYAVTDSWAASLIPVLVLAALIGVAGALLGRLPPFEDGLPARASTTSAEGT